MRVFDCLYKKFSKLKFLHKIFTILFCEDFFMDYVWYSYCLLGLLILGLGDYIKKIVTLKKYDKDVFLSVCFLLYALLFFINFLVFWDGSITQKEILTALPAGAFDVLIPLGMLAALKYSDSSLAFVSIRMITSFTLLAIWAWYFNDNLHVLNLLWFGLWALAIFMLSGFEFGKKHDVSKKWLLGIIMAIFWVTCAYSYFKYFVDLVDIPSFMFLKFSFMALFLFIYMAVRKKWKHFTKKNIKNVLWYAAITTILFLLQFWYVLPKMYSLWPLSISYKILSYSLAVPILLSVIFHNETLTRKKTIAFFLTAMSLLFFFF